MKQIFKSNSLIGLKLIALIAFSVSLMLLDSRSYYFQRFQANASAVAVPLQYLVNAPVQFFRWLGGNLATQQQLLEQNAKLRSQNLLLQAKLQRFEALENENSQLRALLQSSPHMEGEVTMAQILSVDMDPYVQKVVINKGTGNKIYMGQPVLDPYGLLGQVVSVGPFTSQVQLITDPQSAISVQDTRSGVRAIAAGKGEGMQLINLADATDIQVGDLLVTTGLDQRFPQGYPVATVKDVKRDPEFRFATVNLEPVAHTNQSLFVLLVWPVLTPVTVPNDTPVTKPTAPAPPKKEAPATGGSNGE